MKYAAVIQVKNWMVELNYLVKGNSVNDLFYNIYRFQDLDCLLRLGEICGEKEDTIGLIKLNKLIEKNMLKNLKLDDVISLDINLSIGKLKCIDFVEDINAEEILKSKYEGLL